MTWPIFVLTYSLAALALGTLLSLCSPGFFRKLPRLMVAMIALAFFVDQAAESRGIWMFPVLALPAILDVPLENLFFVLATTIYSITAHLAAEALLGSKRIRPRKQGPLARLPRQ